MSGSQIEEMGKMMSSQMFNVYKANTGITVELGSITSNMALSVASLGNAIPKGDYMISRHLTLADLNVKTSKEEDHVHEVALPSNLRGLRAGDRVLVVWVGTEPVVVDIVTSS